MLNIYAYHTIEWNAFKFSNLIEIVTDRADNPGKLRSSHEYLSLGKLRH